MTTENEKCVSTLNETNKLKRYTLFLESDCDMPEEVTYESISYFGAVDQCVSHLGEEYNVGEDDFAIDGHKVEEIA